MADDLERQRVEGGGREPVRELELRPLGKEDGELSALRSHPEAVLAAERVHVRQELAGGDQLAVDPAEAQAGIAARGAGHDAALTSGRQRLPWPDPFLSLRTMTSVCSLRKATSSPNEAAVIRGVKTEVMVMRQRTPATKLRFMAAKLKATRQRGQGKLHSDTRVSPY